MCDWFKDNKNEINIYFDVLSTKLLQDTLMQKVEMPAAPPYHDVREIAE